jgi:hypothetical protein
MEKLTLHEAMVRVLLEQPNYRASTRVISDEIYRKIYTAIKQRNTKFFSGQRITRTYSNLLTGTLLN